MKMMWTKALLLLLLAFSLSAEATTIERRPGESLAALLARTGPADGTLAHPPIESAVWNFTNPAVLAFYEVPKQIDGETSREIDGFVLVPSTAAQYEKIGIDHFGVEGGDPKIETVFFAPVGSDPKKRLFIIVSWPVVHANVNGTLYATYAYDPPVMPGAGKLVFLGRLSDQLSGGCDCVRTDEPSSKAKFKTAGAVRDALKKMK
jgi:hypothetical protein